VPAEKRMEASGNEQVGGPVQDNAANATDSSTVAPVEVGKGMHLTPTAREPATPTPFAGSGPAGEAKEGASAGNAARSILSLEYRIIQPQTSATKDENSSKTALLARCTPTNSPSFPNDGGYLPLCQVRQAIATLMP